VKIREIADKHHLHIIEDAAHAIEASRDGMKVGQLADAACFSFYATKNITSGEGGAVTTGNALLADELKMLRQHGIDRGAADRYTKRYEHWDMPLLGWKYNMDNIQAALLIGQLERIETLPQKREELWRAYEEALKDVRDAHMLRTIAGVQHARHLLAILVPPPKRERLLLALQNRGIGIAVNYRPIHLLKYYRENFLYKEGDFPIAEEIGRRTMSLPFYPDLTRDELAYVVQVLKEELNQ